MARFRHEIEALSCQMALSLSLVAGAPASPMPVALDAIDPWQAPHTPAVEAVEPCSRPLLIQQPWCVYGWVTSAETVGLLY